MTSIQHNDPRLLAADGLAFAAHSLLERKGPLADGDYRDLLRSAWRRYCASWEGYRPLAANPTAPPRCQRESWCMYDENHTGRCMARFQPKPAAPTPEASTAPERQKHDVSFFVQKIADAAKIVGQRDGLDVYLLAAMHLLHHYAEKARESEAAAPARAASTAPGEPSEVDLRYIAALDRLPTVLAIEEENAQLRATVAALQARNDTQSDQLRDVIAWLNETADMPDGLRPLVPDVMRRLRGFEATVAAPPAEPMREVSADVLAAATRLEENALDDEKYPHYEQYADFCTDLFTVTDAVRALAARVASEANT